MTAGSGIQKKQKGFHRNNLCTTGLHGIVVVLLLCSALLQAVQLVLF
jgi:hypothetical protein